MKKMILAAIIFASAPALADVFLARTQVPAALQTQIVNYVADRCPDARGLREIETSIQTDTEDQGVHDHTLITLFDTDNGAFIEVFSAQYEISNPAVANTKVLGLISENGLCKEE